MGVQGRWRKSKLRAIGSIMHLKHGAPQKVTYHCSLEEKLKFIGAHHILAG